MNKKRQNKQSVQHLRGLRISDMLMLGNYLRNTMQPPPKREDLIKGGWSEEKADQYLEEYPKYIQEAGKALGQVNGIMLKKMRAMFPDLVRHSDRVERIRLDAEAMKKTKVKIVKPSAKIITDL